MKSSSNPRNGIPRGISSSENPQSPNPPSQKHQKPFRRPRSGLENVDPNTIADPSLPSPSPASKPSPAAKIRSPLPPRPPPNPLKRKLSAETAIDNGALASADSGVQVIVRMRPSNKEEEEGEQIVQKISTNSLSILDHVFTFDSVADTDSTQHDIFELVGMPLVENCLAGFNSSIFAYGQTGSGKTYTMWGPPNALVEDTPSSNHQKGLTPRVFERLFARINEEQVKQADKQLNYQCRCSFLEIYNEQITDLLDPNQKNLQIREDVKSGVYVDNLTEEYVCTMKDLSQLLIKGLANRRIGSTSINAESSRSHSVFTCVVESRCKSTADGLSSLRSSRINLVDLAGSERQKLTGAAGDRLKEAGNINRSLSQLGNLINILAEVSQSGKQRHIPYRDSRLTFLLQESLGGNAKLAMICAISPSQSCKSETLSTLRFAQRAKAIKNKAVVNEVTQDDVKAMRELIRQLKDELQRIKSNGVYSTGWDAHRSLNLLRLSLNRPATLPRVEDDSDEEMEIDEEDVEKLCLQVGLQSAAFHDVDKLHVLSETACEGLKTSKEKDFPTSVCGSNQDIEEADVNMEDCQSEMASDQVNEHVITAGHEEAVANAPVFPSPDILNPPDHEGNDNEKHMVHTTTGLLDGGSGGQPVEEKLLVSSDCSLLNGGSVDEPVDEKASTRVEPVELVDEKASTCAEPVELVDKKASTCVGPVDEKPSTCVVPVEEKASMQVDSKPALGDSPDITVEDPPQNSPTSLSIVPCESSPVLRSPPLSVSPRVDHNSRKSLRTSSTLTASGRDAAKDINSSTLTAGTKPSLAQSLRNSSSNALSSRPIMNSLMSTENLAASLHRGIQIIDSHQQSSALRLSSLRFSFKPVDLKLFLPVEKVDVGVQTLLEEPEMLENTTEFLCSYCKTRTPQLECNKEANNTTELPLVPVEESQVTEKSKKQVPKAVEKVLAGAIRREMALEEYCSRQAAEITQLNRLVQQYKHERECNAIIEQTREDKIRRLEALMDGVLPTEDFMEEEFVSLANEHKLLREKYENHPEVLRTKIELKRVHDELDGYRNFFDMGERDVLMEEIQHLRSQLQYYVDSSVSPMPTRKQGPLLQLTYPSEPTSAPLGTIPESTEETAEEKFEQERRCWTERESKWISLSEELRLELEASKSLAGKQKQELDSEKKCSEELKEALQMAMQGHARILEQYADLQEKHIALLARHRRITDGIEDVKRAAAKAGVKGAESRFINSLAAEISALKVEREKERRYFRDENKGLQSQLRDTAEAVQAAGELLVRLKEAEEAAAVAQKRATLVEQVAEKAHQEIDELKKRHEREISTLNQFLAESRLPKEALRPTYDDADVPTRYNGGENDQRWRQEFEPLYDGRDSEFSRIAEPSSWFTGYDKCNI
ncbi:kinesin-like protein KIN-12B [Magnolia sinica]|uniref:kinesin-like protein KIN-12B n=1 Tax=Magnolia sinica TaxID=86752 RepID=UPI002658942C|nr:kinesin-like protein KIN-12B [Magnolia sinica]